jgi:CubicO group peptidase (beta-lactamase class C family)
MSASRSKREAGPIQGTGAEGLPETVAVIEEGRREGLHLGAQVYVSRAGEPVADLALGWARPGEELTPDHLMLWLSSTKPVTAVAIATLWEAGALELDDPIARHVPEFAAGGKGAVTIRHALTHTGGFRMAGTGWPDEPWETIVARICERKLEPRWTPGEKAGYHLTSSWFMLGEIARRLDGRPFDRFVRAEVLEPLGMDDSWIGMPAERFRDYAGRIAPLWSTAGAAEAATERGEGSPSGHGWTREERVTRPSPGGNGRGPVRELARFYEAMLAGGARRGRRVLRPQTVEALTARHRVGMFDHTFRHVLDWGLGFIPDNKQYGAGGTGGEGGTGDDLGAVPYGYGRLCSRRAFGHSGYRSSTAFADPVHGLAVAIAFNGTPEAEPHRRRMQRTVEAVYRDLGLG